VAFFFRYELQFISLHLSDSILIKFEREN